MVGTDTALIYKSRREKDLETQAGLRAEMVRVTHPAKTGDAIGPGWDLILVTQRSQRTKLAGHYEMEFQAASLEYGRIWSRFLFFYFVRF